MWDIDGVDPDHGHKPGDYVDQAGRVICHIMRPSYVGSLVLYDCSTSGHEMYLVGRMERYFYNEHAGCWRSVIYDGHRQRILFDHKPGHGEIRELMEDTLAWYDSIGRPRRKDNEIDRR